MLAEIRKQRGLSQGQLSLLSGESLRMIQYYEQGKKDINKAQGSTLFHLSNALRCRMEDLIMKTVIIYRVTCIRGYLMDEQGIRYSLQPWGKNTSNYEGSDDGGQEYEISDGYTVSIGNDEQMHFYDKDGNYIKLITYNGHPALQIEPYPLALKICR